MESTSIFNNDSYMPHGVCYLWQPEILWTTAISDVVIALAYFSITAAMIVFVKRRKDLPYPWFFILAGSIIFVACGLSHLVSAIVIWKPIYGISAVVKAITAVASLTTGIVIWFVLPFFLKLPSPSMLEKKNEALQTSIKTLHFAQDQLVESRKMASLGGLVTGVAHEINTPVGTAVTAVTHLMDFTDNLKFSLLTTAMSDTTMNKFLKEVTICTNMVSKNLNRASDIIMSFKQVAVDQSDKHIRVYNAKRYIDGVLMNLRPMVGQTPYEITMSCDDHIEINGDPGDITQILTNLVVNSLQHGLDGKEEGLITIEITQQDQTILIHYQDNGRGMNKKHLERIYEPFFTTKRGSGNSGLGMHIVYNLVTQSLNGSIDCVSEVDHGVQFSIKFGANSSK
ncbi:MAG: HAMP domain-containing histidine kinase [Pseudomonadales bacterium]|nr:HAMP domain-containing histidine kinase [Pseudomonadales bacterium]NRA18242.1 HAMP domain-containing histidine kinase [Oceanospirillaceae bacterium]